jgi:hypothetical protein
MRAFQQRVLIWAAFLSIAMIAMSARATEVAGVRFDDQAKVAETSLTLNGAGVRSKFMFKVYAIGLYLPRKTNDAAQVIGQPGPKRIRIVTLRDVGAEMFIEGLTKGIEKNHAASEMAALKPRLDQFGATLKGLGELAKGSTVNLDLMPGGSVHLSANGVALGKAIQGEDFYQALLRIWLGANPAQDSLKAELLG